MSTKNSKTKAKSQPNAMVFGQKQEKLTVKVLRSILTSYGRKLKARELRPNLLERVFALESEVSYQDVKTVSQLLEDKVEVTRKAIEAGRQNDEGLDDDYDDDDEDDDSDESEFGEWGPNYYGQNYHKGYGDSGRYGPVDSGLRRISSHPTKGKEDMKALVPEKQRAQSGEILCNICYNKQASENFRKTPPHTHCRFDRMPICNTCMGASVNSQIQFNHWGQINCPLDGEVLPTETVKQYVNAEVLPKCVITI